MHDEVGRLIDDHDLLIVVDDVEADIFGDPVALGFELCCNCQLFAAKKFMFGGLLLTVYA